MAVSTRFLGGDLSSLLRGGALRDRERDRAEEDLERERESEELLDLLLDLEEPPLLEESESEDPELELEVTELDLCNGSECIALVSASEVFGA